MEEKLFKKLEQEMKEYKEYIKERGVEFAIDRAYELTSKQEIIDSLNLNIKIAGLVKNDKHETNTLMDSDFNLIEIDKRATEEEKFFLTDKGLVGEIKYPDEDDITKEQENYIKQYLNKLEKYTYLGDLKYLDFLIQFLSLLPFYQNN